MSNVISVSTAREYLEAAAALVAGLGRTQFTYASPYDFLLLHGREMPWRKLPKRLKRGYPRQCFRNATVVALRSPHLYTYVEGYAVGLCGLPVEHAWCIDRDGYVVDTTWADGDDYFGVAFQGGYVHTMKRGQPYISLIMNYAARFPLLTGEHSVEKALLMP